MAKFILSANDYGSTIKKTILNTLSNDEDRALAEMQSEKELTAYLSGKYDLVALLPTIYFWALSSAYAAESIVYQYKAGKDLFFKAKVAIAADTVLEDGANWEAIDDPRDPLIKEILIDLTLYRTHIRLAPNQIPETRVQKRDDQIKFLRMVSRGDVIVDWPLIDPLNDNGSVTWGSKEKFIKDY